MATSDDYRLDIQSAAGILKDQIVNFTGLSASIAVNRPTLLIAGLDGNHPAIGDLEHRSKIELWRKNAAQGVAWYRVFSGLYLKPKYSQPDKPHFELTAVEDKWLLSTRLVAWYANTTNRSKFINAKAETIMKVLATYNIGPYALLSEGRWRNGNITGVQIEADGAHGNNEDWFCFADNLLETLQKLALVGGGDFNLVKTSDTTYQFRWYTGQLGSDKTSTIIFSLGNGNMANPVYEVDRINEKTVAFVGGKGEESDRVIVNRSGPDYVFATNDAEIFVNGSNIDTTEGLQSFGDHYLEETKKIEKFTFDVIQTDSTVYKRDYDLGDLVTAINPFTGASVTQKVDEINITLDQAGNERIDVRVVTP